MNLYKIKCTNHELIGLLGTVNEVLSAKWRDREFAIYPNEKYPILDNENITKYQKRITKLGLIPSDAICKQIKGGYDNLDKINTSKLTQLKKAFPTRRDELFVMQYKVELPTDEAITEAEEMLAMYELNNLLYAEYYISKDKKNNPILKPSKKTNFLIPEDIAKTINDNRQHFLEKHSKILKDLKSCGASINKLQKKMHELAINARKNSNDLGGKEVLNYIKTSIKDHITRDKLSKSLSELLSKDANLEVFTRSSIPKKKRIYSRDNDLNVQLPTIEPSKGKFATIKSAKRALSNTHESKSSKNKYSDNDIGGTQIIKEKTQRIIYRDIEELKNALKLVNSYKEEDSRTKERPSTIISTINEISTKISKDKGLENQIRR